MERNNLFFIGSFTHNAKSNLPKEKIIENLTKGMQVNLSQPCNCSNNIRHFTGGNYHYSVEITLNNDTLTLNWSTSCELTLQWFVETEYVNFNQIDILLNQLEQTGFVYDYSIPRNISE